MEWKDLNYSDKAQLMQLYLRNGITDLNEMRVHYNMFANGGYREWLKMEAVKNAKLWKVSVSEAYNNMINDKTYNYEAFYNAARKDPVKYSRDEEGNYHYSDIGKTVFHPTASKESMYSGVKHGKYNPTGAIFGDWIGDHEYRMSNDMIKTGSNPNETFNYMMDAEERGVRLRDENGNRFKVNPNDDNDNALFIEGVLPAITVNANKKRYI